MNTFLKFFGWTLIVPAALLQIYLWIKAYGFISDKIGSFLAFLLVLLTNVFIPFVYIIWYWIDKEFPTQYFLLGLTSYIVVIIGAIIKQSGSE